MSTLIILLATLCLACANGANDNFKGVATLLGSGTASYTRALAWATVTTLCGSLAAVFLAQTLLERFSGKGLVDAALVGDPRFAASVALGAGLTVLAATRLGLPISTTHGLVGALVGTGLAAGASLDLAQLAANFFGPLLVSPLLALAAVCLVYPAGRVLARRVGITAHTCLCLNREVLEVLPAGSHAAALQRAAHLSLTRGEAIDCRREYQGRVLGIEAAAAVDRLHYTSAGIVSFARGLNDTPKIAALLLLAPFLSGTASLTLVGLAIAVGGLCGAQRVANTMSHKITAADHGQGLAANLMTSLVVIGASRLGLPISTTHVSCGALFGIGLISGQARWTMIGTICAAWVTTLPAGAALGGLSYLLLG